MLGSDAEVGAAIFEADLPVFNGRGLSETVLAVAFARGWGSWLPFQLERQALPPSMFSAARWRRAESSRTGKGSLSSMSVPKRFVLLPRLPQAKKKHREFAGHRHHRPLLGVLAAFLR
jgi:hypothetical protein